MSDSDKMPATNTTTNVKKLYFEGTKKS